MRKYIKNFFAHIVEQFVFSLMITAIMLLFFLAHIFA